MTLFKALRATMPSSERRMIPASSIVTVLGKKASAYIVCQLNTAHETLVAIEKFESNFVRIQ